MQWPNECGERTGTDSQCCLAPIQTVGQTSSVAPVVQADWEDVVALIPLKDAPEPGEVE